jgi:hypothetical protein
MRLHKSFSNALFVFVLIAAPLFGHHSIAVGFDATKAMTIQGVITREWN